MSFLESLTAAKTVDERKALIEEVLGGEDWSDFLQPFLKYGGWPENEEMKKITLEETDKQILAHVELSFIESVPSSCKDINREHEGTAYVTVTIDRATGNYEMSEEGVSIGDGSAYDDDGYESEYDVGYVAQHDYY